MEPIQIVKSPEAVKKQLNILIQRDFLIYKHSFFILIGWTVAVVSLFVFTNDQSFTDLKGVLSGLTIIIWLIAFIVFLVLLGVWVNRIRWRNKEVKKYMDDPTQIFLEFDEEKIVFATETSRNEFKWNHFGYYLENDDFISLVNHYDILQSTSFSPSEIGSENFNELRNIIRSKLNPYQRNHFEQKSPSRMKG